jgi:hypothetical protein
MTEENYGAEEVIEAFGGPTQTAVLCEVSKSAVSQWKTNGIPKAQLKFLRAARPDVFERLAARVPAVDGPTSTQ